MQADARKPRVLIAATQFARVRELAGALRPRLQIDSSSSFADARARAVADPAVDAIIVDEIDGGGALALCRALVADGVAPGVPVLFVTDCSAVSVQRDALDAGASECIVRPLVPTVVQARVLGQIALSQQRLQLAELTIWDEETGIHNRKHFDHMLEDEWDRACRRRVPLSLLLFEVDDLRGFRDAYGESAGSTAIKQAASVLDGSVRRPGDLAARWAETRLAVLLPETDNEGAGRVADRLRRDVERLRIPYHGSRIGEVVTVSVAAVTARGERGIEVSELVGAAEQMIEEARRRGQNRVVRALVGDLKGPTPIARVLSPRGVEYLAQLDPVDATSHAYRTRMT